MSRYSAGRIEPTRLAFSPMGSASPAPSERFTAEKSSRCRSLLKAPFGANQPGSANAGHCRERFLGADDRHIAGRLQSIDGNYEISSQALPLI